MITENNEINPSEMSQEELTKYKQHIATLINRLISEGCVEPDVTTTADDKLRIELKLKEPTWYKELDGNTKELVFKNARFHAVQRLKGLNMFGESADETLESADKTLESTDEILKNTVNEITEHVNSMEDID